MEKRISNFLEVSNQTCCKEKTKKKYKKRGLVNLEFGFHENMWSVLYYSGQLLKFDFSDVINSNI